jgi:hypothetical protein
MHPLLQRFSASSRVVGIELIGGATDLRAHLVVLRRKRSQMEVEIVITDIDSLTQLKKYIPQGIPIIVVLSGKGILHRTVESVAGTDPAALLHKVLPNAASSDFRVHHIEAARGRKIISVVRKSAAEEQLRQLRELDLSVVACSLGASAAAEVLPLLTTEAGNILQIGVHQLQFVDGQISDMTIVDEQQSERKLDLGGKSIPITALAAFAAALQQFTGAGTARIADDELQTAADDFQQRRLFRLGGLSLLAVVLILLLGNTLIFFSYWEKKNNLKEQLQVNGGMLEQVHTLEKQVAARRRFLIQTGVAQADRHSFFADRLANDLPETLTLTRMAIAPRERIAVEDSIAFRPGIILLEGECSRSIELNNWIGKLNSESWINKASLLSYKQPNSKNTGLFEIEIQLSE